MLATCYTFRLVFGNSINKKRNNRNRFKLGTYYINMYMGYQVIILTDIATLQLGYGKYAGAYKVATEVRKAGYTCQVIDNYTQYGIDKLKVLMDKFVDSSTLLIGISCALNERRIGNSVFHWGFHEEAFMDFLRYTRSLNPNLKTVAGGPRIYENSSWPEIDYTIINKADNSIVALVDHLNGNRDIKFENVGPTKLIRETDYPYTQEEFKNSTIQYEHNDIIIKNEALPLEIARGCIFSCSFCKYDLIGKRAGEWTKDPNTLRNELIRNYEMFGTTHYNISDELINESIDKLKMWCDVTTSLPFKIGYTGYARVDLIWRYPEMRELLLESGAECLLFGIETLHEKAGRAIGKGLNPDKIKETLHYCKETWDNKIIMCSNFIVGLPHEPVEHIWESFDYLLSDDCPLDIVTYTPLGITWTNQDSSNKRGLSKIEVDPKKYGITIDVVSNEWTGTHMSSKESEHLYKEILNHPKFRKMRNFSGFKWFGRVISLGYTGNEILTMLRDKSVFFNGGEIAKRTKDMKLKYYQLLLES